MYREWINDSNSWNIVIIRGCNILGYYKSDFSYNGSLRTMSRIVYIEIYNTFITSPSYY